MGIGSGDGRGRKGKWTKTVIVWPLIHWLSRWRARKKREDDDDDDEYMNHGQDRRSSA